MTDARGTRSALLAALGSAWFLTAAAACSPSADSTSPPAPTPAPAPAHVIPAPTVLTVADGGFRLDANTTLEPPPADLEEVVRRETDKLRHATGLPLAPQRGGPPNRIRIDRDASLPHESYRLHTNRDEVVIEAGGPAGVFYAFQTLRLLLPAEIEELPAERRAGAAANAVGRGAAEPVAWVIPAVAIEDSPRFGYRGLHLDVGRYFFGVEVVKKYIDTMARFKLNRFHWHLTEDQGWRLQIDAYPRLTEVGAWRAESPVEKNLEPYIGDGQPHGGFYTKDEVREIVAYAADRFVTVIPEIELPGHATAALASYPELGCTDDILPVSTTWGIHESVFCPHEETFAFLETVLSEVMELFPSEYIHIGGDEVPKRQWRDSGVAQEVIRRESLADEDELQSWFIRRIERHLRANGRRLIGWDEILEGGLAPDATVMSWRGTEGGIAAARQGHDVIMTPVEHAYFDFYQGDEATEPLAMSWAGFPIPLATVYAFEPVPAVLTRAETPHILGAQGNVWTEYIRTPEYLEYMAYPRALALAEVTWSAREARNWDDFVARLPAVLAHLDAMGVNYRPPEETAADPRR